MGGRTDDNREVAETSIIEMMMMSKAHLFVGQGSSNFYRTALELKSSNCDCVPAFYSLDAPWCFDFAVKAGKNVYVDTVRDVKEHEPWKFPWPLSKDNHAYDWLC